ncbi:hypothetical protein ACJX0J_007998 [Zea mays]
MTKIISFKKGIVFLEGGVYKVELELGKKERVRGALFIGGEMCKFIDNINTFIKNIGFNFINCFKINSLLVGHVFSVIEYLLLIFVAKIIIFSTCESPNLVLVIEIQHYLNDIGLICKMFRERKAFAKCFENTNVGGVRENHQKLRGTHYFTTNAFHGQRILFFAVKKKIGGSVYWHTFIRDLDIRKNTCANNMWLYQNTHQTV